LSFTRPKEDTAFSLAQAAAEDVAPEADEADESESEYDGRSVTVSGSDSEDTDEEDSARD
jgi:hypothetical protein